MFRFKTLITHVALETFSSCAVVTFEMPAQKLFCGKVLLANMTAELSIVKMVCQVTFELCSVCEMPNGLTQFALYFQRIVECWLMYKVRTK